jgi:hypothetical protein
MRYVFWIGLHIMMVVMYSCIGSIKAKGEPANYSLGVREVAVTWQKIANKRTPLQPDIRSADWGDHVAVEPSLYFLKRGFFDSEWYFDTAFKKVTEVGLKFDMGVSVFSWADILYTHWSYHSADKLNSYNNVKGYGLEDYVGVRLRFKP